MCCRLFCACLPAPYQPSTNAVAVAFALPRLALATFALELRGAPFWLVPWRLVAALAKALWGTVCLPAVLVFGRSQVCTTGGACARAFGHSQFQIPAAHIRSCICVQLRGAERAALLTGARQQVLMRVSSCQVSEWV